MRNRTSSKLKNSLADYSDALTYVAVFDVDTSNASISPLQEDGVMCIQYDDEGRSYNGTVTLELRQFEDNEIGLTFVVKPKTGKSLTINTCIKQSASEESIRLSFLRKKHGSNRQIPTHGEITKADRAFEALHCWFLDSCLKRGVKQ